MWLEGARQESSADDHGRHIQETVLALPSKKQWS